MEFNEQTRAYEFAPAWKIEFRKTENNALIDDLIMLSSNPSYNVQKIQVIILDELKPYRFENVGNTLSTGPLKSRLSSIYKKYYNLESWDCHTCTESDSYPIAVRIFFERFGESQDTTVMYNYHFKSYFSGEQLRFKSQGAEFVKYLPGDSAKLSRELISYNLSSSFLSNISDASFEIKVSMALAHPTYRYLMEYAISNLGLYEHKIVFTPEGKKKTALGTFTLRLPKSLYDSVARISRDQIVDKINATSGNYDEALNAIIIKIKDSEKAFTKVEAKSRVDLIKGNDIIANQKQWDEWYQVNQELISLIAKRMEI